MNYRSEIPWKIRLSIALNGVRVNMLNKRIYALKIVPSPLLIVEKMVEKARRTMSLW